MSLKFYADPLSQPSQTVHYVLKRLEVPHEYVLKYAGQDTTTEEYKAINPVAKVPSIVQDDFPLRESAAIIRYLCNTHEGGESLYPREDYKHRALVDMWLDFNASELRHKAEDCWVKYALGHLFFGLPEASKEEKENTLIEIYKKIKVSLA